MIRLQLIRHGPVSPRYEKRFIGTRDVPLAQAGRNAARQIALELAHEIPGSVFVSPLARAVETALLLFPHASRRVLADLRERSLGTWELQSKSDMKRRFPEAFLPSGRLDPLYSPPGAESIAAVGERLDRVVRIAMTAKPPIWLVTHNAVIQVLKAWTAGTPIRDGFMYAEPHLTPIHIELTSDMPSIAAHCRIVSDGLPPIDTLSTG